MVMNKLSQVNRYDKYMYVLLTSWAWGMGNGDGVVALY